MNTRRNLIKTMTAAGALAVWDAPIRYAFAKAPTDRRLVVVVLRGALDGLAAVPPHGDKDYASMRANLALDTTGPTAIHDLDGFFGLNPGLTNMKAMYDAREVLIFHNICSPYQNRSHFDCQNVLETGAVKPHLVNDGWLNRALTPIGLATGTGAVAVDQTPPLILAGPARTTSWMPAVMPEPDSAFIAKVKQLYASDTALSAALSGAVDLQAQMKTGEDDPYAMSAQHKAAYGNLTPLFAGAGKLLAGANGPRIAVLEAGGWDTHVQEGASTGNLTKRLQTLDQALDALKTSLGPEWSKTVVVMATEFGRTVKPNGSGGTDHGTGTAAYVLGGAVAGGHVRAEWVGLNPSVLKDGRDQPARTDLRALFKGVLAEHLGVSRQALDTAIFPDSGNVTPLKGLVRV